MPRLVSIWRRGNSGRRRIKRRQYGGKRKGGLKGFTKVQANTIRKAIGRSEETKYYANQLMFNAQLDAAIHTPGVDVVPLVPQIRPGTAENQRDGRRVTPTKCYVDLNVTFNQVVTGPSTPNPAIVTARELYVVIYLLRSKTYKNWQQWLAAPSPQTNYLLDDGAGNSVPFGYNDPTLGFIADTRFLSYPVDVSEFTQVKKKIVKLVRNDGIMNGTTGAVASPNLPQSSWRGRFYYRLPKLIYDDSAAVTGGFPTNNCTIMAIGYCNSDNGTTVVPDGFDAITVTARAHYFFKDS